MPQERHPIGLIRRLARGLARRTDDGSRARLLSDRDFLLLPSSRRLLAELCARGPSECSARDGVAAYRITPVRAKGLVRFPLDDGASRLARVLWEEPSLAVTASLFRYYVRTDLFRCLEKRAPMIARVRLASISHDTPIDHVMVPRFDGQELVAVQGWFCVPPDVTNDVDPDWTELLHVLHERRARPLRLPGRILWPRDQSAPFFGMLLALNSSWRWDPEAV